MPLSEITAKSKEELISKIIAHELSKNPSMTREQASAIAYAEAKRRGYDAIRTRTPLSPSYMKTTGYKEITAGFSCPGCGEIIPATNGKIVENRCPNCGRTGLNYISEERKKGYHFYSYKDIVDFTMQTLQNRTDTTLFNEPKTFTCTKCNKEFKYDKGNWQSGQWNAKCPKCGGNGVASDIKQKDSFVHIGERIVPLTNTPSQRGFSLFGKQSCQSCRHVDYNGDRCGQPVSPMHGKVVTTKDWCRFHAPVLHVKPLKN